MKNINKLLLLIGLFSLSLQAVEQSQKENNNYQKVWICTMSNLNDSIFEEAYCTKEDCYKYCKGISTACLETKQPGGLLKSDTDTAEFWSARSEGINPCKVEQES
jgi:hypothetical protein